MRISQHLVLGGFNMWWFWRVWRLVSWYMSCFMNNLNFFANKCYCKASHLRDVVFHGPMRPCGILCRRCLHLVRRLGRNRRYVIVDFHFFRRKHAYARPDTRAIALIMAKFDHMVWRGGCAFAGFTILARVCMHYRYKVVQSLTKPNIH